MLTLMTGTTTTIFLVKKDDNLKVVIRLKSKLLGEVVTAYPSDSGKVGEKIIWMPSSD
jgi:hypothetical protein